MGADGAGKATINLDAGDEQAAWAHLLAAAATLKARGTGFRQVIDFTSDGKPVHAPDPPPESGSTYKYLLRDAWLVLKVLQTALAAPAGPAAEAVRAFAKQAAPEAADVFLIPGLLARTGKAKKIETLLETLRENLPTLDPDDEAAVRAAQPWAKAEAVVWEFEGQLQDPHYPEDQFAWEGGIVSHRFLAHVCLALPKAQRDELLPLANRVLAAHKAERDSRRALSGHEVNEQLNDVRLMRDALAQAWAEAAAASKKIAMVDAEWFLNRALEALGEKPHEATSGRRMRKSRARNRKPR